MYRGRQAMEAMAITFKEALLRFRSEMRNQTNSAFIPMTQNPYPSFACSFQTQTLWSQLECQASPATTAEFLTSLGESTILKFRKPTGLTTAPRQSPDARATDAHNYDVDMHLHHDTLHGPGGHFLRWKPDKAADYVTHLELDTPARQKLYRAIHNENVEQVWTCLKSWILEAALRTGMTTSGTHAPKRPAQRERAAWFDEECRKKKQMLLDVVIKGGAHMRDQLLREYRAQTQRCQTGCIKSKQHMSEKNSTKI